jgi:hypothetical protein
MSKYIQLQNKEENTESEFNTLYDLNQLTSQNEQNQEISNDVFCQIFQNSNTLDFEDEEEEDNERYYIKGFKENETTMLGKKRKIDISDKNIIKNENTNNKRTKESTGENSLKKIEKKEKSDDIKHQFRNDYIVKKIKVNCFSDYMTEELNKATINLTFLDEQKYLKIYMPNNKAFTSIASLKKNLEFLPMTLKDIYTLCKGGEKQDKNKVLFAKIFNYQDPKNIQKLDEIKMLLNMTAEEAIERYYHSEAFEEFRSQDEIRKYDERFFKEKGFYLLQQYRNENGFVKYLKGHYY